MPPPNLTTTPSLKPTEPRVAAVHYQCATVAAKALQVADNPAAIDRAAVAIASALAPWVMVGNKLAELLRSVVLIVDDPQFEAVIGDWHKVTFQPDQAVPVAAVLARGVLEDDGVKIELGQVVLYYGPKYAIDLDQIKTESDLLAWTIHLASKRHMTRTRLRRFMEVVADFKEWKVVLR